MADKTTTMLSACGRPVGPAEIEHAREVVRMCSGLTRTELALTLCEHWEWVGVSGKPQVRAATKLLERLERAGVLELPAKREAYARSGRRKKATYSSDGTEPEPNLYLDLRSLRPVWLEKVESRDDVRLWNAFLQRYHPQGTRRPFGCSLRYFVTSNRGQLGCLLLDNGSRALRCRDEWIGWSAQQRLRNLPLVVNNSRYLLFKWVHVPHLASHVLGQLSRRVRDDWHCRWGYKPVLLETFIDPAHRGTCYHAAGWEAVGETSGRGLQLRGHSYSTNRKRVLVRPLVRDFRKRLLTPTEEPHEMSRQRPFSPR